MKYKFLLFDADNTLLDFTKAEREGITKTFQELHIPLDDALRQRYVELNKSLWKQYERGEKRREEILYQRFDILFETIGVTVDGHKAEEIYRKYLNEGSYVMEGALQLLQKLCKKYAIYIITNGIKKTQMRRLTESGIASCVKDIFISEEVGAQKPTKEYFDYVKARIPGFDENQAMVIGDSLSSDILGGINAGMDTCYLSLESSQSLSEIQPTYVIHNLMELKEILSDI